MIKYTLEELESKSDRQLDFLVAKKYLGMSGDKDIQKMFSRGKFNYCNSWAYMGPIIEEKRINVIPIMSMDASWFAIPENGHHKQRSAGNNPTRCAVIAYLLMD